MSTVSISHNRVHIVHRCMKPGCPYLHTAPRSKQTLGGGGGGGGGSGVFPIPAGQLCVCVCACACACAYVCSVCVRACVSVYSCIGY